MRRLRRSSGGIRLPDRLRAGHTTLRPWREDDLDQLVAACRDPAIVRFTRMPSAPDRLTAREYIDTRGEAARAGSAASLAVVAADDPARLLGSISLFAISSRHLRAEVGYWLAPAARGRGHATAAVDSISRWGFGDAGLERIELHAATINAASQRVAERAGFRREAVLRRCWRGKAEHLDMVCFGRLASDLT